MKTFILFHWDNCPNCDAIKEPLKLFVRENKLNIYYYHLNEDTRKFRDYQVKGIPTLLEIDPISQKEIGQRLVWSFSVNNIKI